MLIKNILSKIACLAFLLIGNVWGEVRFCKDFQTYSKDYGAGTKINPTKPFGLGDWLYNIYPIVFHHLDTLYLRCESSAKIYREFESTNGLLSKYSSLYFVERTDGDIFKGHTQEVLLTTAVVSTEDLMISNVSFENSAIQIRIALQTAVNIYSEPKYTGINLILGKLEGITALNVIELCACITKLAKETSAGSSKGALGTISGAVKTGSATVSGTAGAASNLGKAAGSGIVGYSETAKTALYDAGNHVLNALAGVGSTIGSLASDIVGSASSAVFGTDPGRWSAIRIFFGIVIDLNTVKDTEEYKKLSPQAKENLELMKSIFTSYACSLAQSYYEGGTVYRALNG